MSIARAGQHVLEALLPARLGRLGKIRDEADSAARQNDKALAIDVADRLKRLYAGRKDVAWGLQRLAEHEHEEVTAAYGHLGRGFAPRSLRALLARTGLEVELCEVTSRERRKPYFEVLSAFAHRPLPGAARNGKEPS